MIAPVLTLPMELECQIFSELSREDRLRLRGVCRQFKNDIDVEYPKYVAKLDAARRIELGWMKFQDRPLYQKVGLVSLCIIFSPIIAVYHSRDIIGFISRLYTPRIKRMVQMISQQAFKALKITAQWSYENVVTPVGHTIKHVFEKIAVPLAKGIQRVVNTVFNDVVVPLANGVQRVANTVFNDIVVPLAKGIQRVATSIFTDMVVPLARGLKRAAKLSYEWILTPLAKAVKQIFIQVVIPAVRFICNQVVVPILRFSITKIVIPGIEKVIIPLCKAFGRSLIWTINTIAYPVARVVHAIAKGLLITLPNKVYQHVLTPIGHAISRISTFALTYLLKPIYHHVMLPLGNCIHLAGRITYERVLTPLAILTHTLATVIFVQIPVEAYNFVILQTQMLLSRFAPTFT